MTQAHPLIQTLPMTLGAPMSDDPGNPATIEIPLQIELPNGQTLFAAVALGGLPFDGQRQIAERMAAAWNAFAGIPTQEIKAHSKCLHQITEPAATPFMHGIADGCGNAYFEEGCVAPEANDLQPEVDGLNSCLDEDEAPYRVVALYAHPAQLSAVQTTKVVGALEMLENGALNVAENAKNRGDDYGVGYAQAMAKMARDTLDVLSAPAHPAEGVPAQGMEQNAERYLWLREQHDKGDDSVTIFIGDEQRAPGHLDAQVDAAIAAQAKQGGA